MTTKIAKRVTRLALYFERVRSDMRKGDAAQAIADSAELCYLANRLCHDFEELAKQNSAETQARASSLDVCAIRPDDAAA